MIESIEQDDATYFATNPVFDCCSTVDVARLIPHLQQVQVKAGETLYKTGEKPGMMYLIKRGKLKLNSGKRFISEIQPGSIVGQEAAIGLDAYQADAVADEEVVAIALSADMIQPLMAENKQLNSKIHRSFLNLFTEINNKIDNSVPKNKDIEIASTKITIGWLLAVILPLVIMHYGSEWNFNWNERVFIAVASATITMWVFGVVPEFVPAIFAILSLVILGVVPKQVVLSGFTSSSFFMAIGIFSLGAVLLTSGLTYRIVLKLLRILPKKQSALGLGLLSIGVALTPVIPSTNGRASLIAPIFVDMFKSVCTNIPY
jgi:DASS family divalent anion:Na+ symporter